CSLYFFFQAEDGIRDRNVTGVQTCALPIYVRPALTRVPAVSPLPKPTPRRSCAYRRCCLRTLTRHPRELRLPVRRPITVQLSTRSEERRVGKECISRLTTVQYIKSVTLEMT